MTPEQKRLQLKRILAESDEQKHLRKNKIIADLFNSGEIQTKISGILYRNKVGVDTYIHEDLLQVVMMKLCEKSSDYILEMYFDNPRRLIGLATTIAVLKGVANDHSKHPDLPSANLVKYILYGSNLDRGNLNFIHPTEAFEADCTPICVDESTEQNPEDDMWECIREGLSDDEKEHLEEYLLFLKKRGRPKKEIKLRNDQLLNKIEEIIIKNKYLI